MLTSTDTAECNDNGWDNGAASADDLPLPNGQSDRRGAHRFKTAFRPGCLIINSRVVFGMIRNMSKHGVMIEVDMALHPGQRIGYFWDESRLVAATVVWSDGNRHGLTNEAEQLVFDKEFSYRSVRVPCTFEVAAWNQGNRQRVQVANLSLGGIQLRNLHARTGDRLTISIAGFEIYNAEVRWNDGGLAGIKFAERLKRQELSAILSHDEVRFERLEFD